jgi:2-C-methyl-D-erythritol 4-phosphate cytidylyltransferase
MNKYAIIVAGGTGTRMGLDYPKQFMPIHGVPLIAYTLRAFLQIPELKIIVVIHPKHTRDLEEIIEEFKLNKNKIIYTTGGESRFDSVKNGLDLIQDKASIVAVHDAVRPFVSLDMLEKGFEMARQKSCAVPVVSAKDSVRILDEDESKSIDRTKVALVQTPQIFSTDVLKEAYKQTYLDTFTDDASVWESAGHKVYLFEGSYKNLKITTPEDVIWAELMLNSDHL